MVPALVAVTVAAGVATIRAGHASSAAKPAATVQDIHVDGYPLANDLASIVAFGGNRDVVVGTVQAIGVPRWNTADYGRPAGWDGTRAPRGRAYQISRPLTVRVDTVLRGALQAGHDVVVRALGGQRDGVRFTFEHAAPASTYRVGGRYVFFLTRWVDAGDGTVASTPNFVFTVVGTTARLSSGEYAVPLAELSTLVRRSG
jgi:hypothetical protein